MIDYKIIRCQSGIGECWELYPTNETFDTYKEAREHLAKVQDEMS